MSKLKQATKSSHEDADLHRALWRFFRESDTPAVVCTKDLEVLAATKSFAAEIDADDEGDLAGRSLVDLLPNGSSFRTILEGNRQSAVNLPGGRTALATATTTDDLLLLTLDTGLVGTRLAETSRKLEEERRVLEIGRLLSSLLTEDDLVGVVARGLRDLFENRRFAVRVIDPFSKKLSSLYAEGTLIRKEHDVLTLKRSSVLKMEISEEFLRSDKVAVSEKYHRIFEDTDTGLGVPLASGRQLLGMINLEGSFDQFSNPEADERIVISLANHLSVALRNTRLLREARYLRGYLEKLIDNANALIMVMNDRGRISVFNRAFQALSGFSREEVIGEPFTQLLAEEDHSSINHMISLALQGRAATNVEASVVARDGRRVRVAFNSAAVLDSDGRVESVIAIGNDLSRIWELKRQIIQAEKLASLGQLSAAVVHELNNPLTSITVYAEYIRDRLAELGVEQDVEKASRILESADRILDFTRGLVAYARPSDERPSRLDLRRVIEQSVKLCDHIIKCESIQLDLQWTADMPHVMGNSSRLEQVFVNLITNACHAVESGGEICISTHIVKDFLEIQLRDNGRGMAPEVSARIFEPFFSTKAPGKGTGLGLSIVQEIVRGHGGTITVESEPDKGSVFLIRLPTVADDK